MRQTSASQIKGARPFFTRTRLVCSKARFSMSLGSTGVAGVGFIATGRTDVISLASCPRTEPASNRMNPAIGNRRSIATSRVANEANDVQQNFAQEEVKFRVQPLGCRRGPY